MAFDNIHTIAFLAEDLLAKNSDSELLISLLKRFRKVGHTIWLYTLKDVNYARSVSEKLHIQNLVDEYVAENTKRYPNLLFSQGGLTAFDEDKKIKVSSAAFDVRGTLCQAYRKKDGLQMRKLLKYLKKLGIFIIVWTGSGRTEAGAAVADLGLQKYVDETRSKMDELELPDVAFDDDELAVLLARYVTVRV
jgi:hypothetical protein